MMKTIRSVAFLMIVAGCTDPRPNVASTHHTGGGAKDHTEAHVSRDRAVTVSSSKEPSEEDWNVFQDHLDTVRRYIRENRPTEQQALRLWQEMLDADPPQSEALLVRLMMSAPLSAPYNPGLSLESFRDGAVPWLEQLVQGFGDCHSHEAMMLAKIQLGKLYCSGQYSAAEFEKATTLWWEVVNVPEKEIVFDDPRHAHLNLDAIAKARGNVRIGGLPEDEVQRQAMIESVHLEVDRKHRERLREERRNVAESLRVAAMRQLTYDFAERGVSRRRTRQRLLFLKRQRRDDRFYQETIDKILRDFDRDH